MPFPKNSAILAAARPEERGTLRRFLLVKPTRTLSGVAPVAVMTSPYPCPHGKCLPNSEKLNQQELSLGELAKRLNDSLSGIQSSINTILTSIQDLDKKVASMEQRVKKTIQLHGADREQEKWTFVATENTQDGRPALEIRCNDTLSGRFFANALSRNPIINPTINPPIVTPAMAALCNQDNNQPILSKTLPPVEPLNKGSDSIEKSSPERVTSPNRVGNFSISMNTPGKKQKKSATSSSSSSSFRPLGSTIVESIAVPKP